MVNQSHTIAAERNPVSRGTKELNLCDSSFSNLISEISPPKFWLYIVGLNTNTTPDEVKQLVCNCLEIDGNVDIIRLVPKGADISTYTTISFKIAMDPVLKDTVLQPSSWPKNLQFREFADYGNRKPMSS